MLKNDDYKPLWDFSLRTDHETGARRMDLVLIDKSDKSCQIRCGNSRGWTGERNEKDEKYQDPAGEKFENCRVFLGLPRLLLLPGARENTSLNIISCTRIHYLQLLLNMNMNMNSRT